VFVRVFEPAPFYSSLLTIQSVNLLMIQEEPNVGLPEQDWELIEVAYSFHMVSDLVLKM